MITNQFLGPVGCGAQMPAVILFADLDCRKWKRSRSMRLKAETWSKLNSPVRRSPLPKRTASRSAVGTSTLLMPRVGAMAPQASMTFYHLIESRRLDSSIGHSMISEFDQNTIANMTAALDYVCKKIPPESDSSDLRKRIGDEITRTARSGKRNYVELRGAGLNVLKATIESRRFGWLGLRWLFRKRVSSAFTGSGGQPH